MIERKSERLAVGQTDRQIHRQTDTQTDGRTDIEWERESGAEKDNSIKMKGEENRWEGYKDISYSLLIYII